MRCAACDRNIGNPDFSIGPNRCSCGFIQTNAEGAGEYQATVQAAWTKWGDMAAYAINKTTGIQPCGGCKRRQAALNRSGAWLAGLLRIRGV